MNNEINFLQSMMSSMMSNQMKPGTMGAGLQGFRQGAMPNIMPNAMPFLGDASRMSREAAGGMNSFQQANSGNGNTGAFLQTMMNMLSQYQNAGGLGANQNAFGGQYGYNQGQNVNNQGQYGYNQGQNVNNQGQNGNQGLNPESWSQGKEGNCASVATIKAAQKKFGNNTFKNVQQTANGGYQVTMQDGKKVSLTKEEMDTAKRMSGFKGEGAGLDNAQLSYAVMAKNALASGHEGARTFAQACGSLNNGEDPLETAKFLGIEGHVKSVNPGSVTGSSAAVVWSNQHALFESGGTMDKYGQQTAFNGTDTIGHRLTNAFVLV
jgi:hypothetical protein